MHMYGFKNGNPIIGEARHQQMPGTHERPESKPRPPNCYIITQDSCIQVQPGHPSKNYCVEPCNRDMVIYLDDQNQKETVWPVLHTQTSSSKISLSIKRMSKTCGEIAPWYKVSKRQFLLFTVWTYPNRNLHICKTSKTSSLQKQKTSQNFQQQKKHESWFNKQIFQKLMDWREKKWHNVVYRQWVKRVPPCSNTGPNRRVH